MDAQMQKQMTSWLLRFLALLPLAMSCRGWATELLGSSGKRSKDSNNRLAFGTLVRALVGLFLSSVSAQVSADWDAGAAGCFTSFQTAMAAVCAINNPDSTSIPGSVYYRDSCVMTSIPNFRVYAHAVDLATGNSFSFAYTLSLTQCDFTISLSGGSEVEPSNGSPKTLPFIATVIDQNTKQPPNHPVNVRISLKVDSTSGGHDHGDGTRPRGGIAGKGTCPTDDECWSNPTVKGAVVFNFNPTDASGTHTITATCDGCSNTATKSVDVKVEGLIPILGSVYYALTEDGGTKVIGDNGNHLGNHYLTSDASMQLWRLAASFYNYQILKGVAKPTLLHLNDASLKWGGLFDKDGDWDTPHEMHRKGVVIDIRANTTTGNIPESMFNDFEKLADETKLSDGTTSANAELHCSRGRDPAVDNCVGDVNRHYHVLLLGVDQ